MTDDIQTQETPDPPRRRRGCSCWGMLLYGVVGLLVFLIVAWMGLSSMVRYQVEQRVKSGEMPLIEQWAETPMDVRWDLLPSSENVDSPVSEQMRSYPSVLPPDGDATRHEFFRLMDELNVEHHTTLEQTLVPLHEKMTAAADLTPADVDNITTISKKIEPAVSLARELATMPGYVHEHPENWNAHYSYEFSSGLYTLEFYAFSQLYSRHEIAAVDTADLTMGLVQWRTNITHLRRNDLVLRRASNIMSNFALVLEMRTSDSAVLARALEVMNRHRESLHTLPDAMLVSEFKLFQMFRDAKQLGYLSDNEQTNAPTPLMLLQFKANANTFHNWVIRNLKPDSEQYKRSVKILEFGRQSKSDWTIIDRAIGVLADIFHSPLNLIARPIDIIFAWDNYRSVVNDRDKTLVTYDLTRLHLARRIAELRGDSLPVTEQDFVPKYMPEFPTDPHTGKPYEFTDTEQMFFSAGPDDILNNSDDIKLELPSGIYVPPKPLTPEEEAEATRMFEDMSGGMFLPVTE